MPKTAELTPRTVGDMCLHYLAENPAQLAEFMSITGYSPDSLRKAVGGGMLDHGLIDYVAANESLLLAVSANSGIRPDEFMRIWARLNPSG